MTTTTRRDLPTRYDAAAVEPGIYERWLESGAFSPAAEPPPGAERFVITMPPPNVTGALHNGHALFVTRRGPADPLPPHARRRHAVGARRRPRQHRRAVRARQDHRRGGRDARLAGPRALPRAHVAVHGRDARRHRPADATAGRQRRLVAASASPWTTAAPGRCGSPSSGCGTRTWPTAARRWSTGARAAAPRSATWRTSSTRRPGRCGRIRYHLARADGTPDPDALDRGGHHAPGDDLRRHGGGGAPGGRSLPGAGRPRGDPAVPRPAPADHRRRARGARVRHRGGEDHAGPRLRRLRGRAAPRPADDQRPRRGRAPQRGGGRVRRPGSLRGARR